MMLCDAERCDYQPPATRKAKRIPAAITEGWAWVKSVVPAPQAKMRSLGQERDVAFGRSVLRGSWADQGGIAPPIAPTVWV
jgi:hypothetical protein